MQPNEVHNFDTLERNIDAVDAAVGNGLWGTVLADPLYYVGFLFAFVAAIAFLLFLRGFLSGFPKVLSQDYHEEHQEHHRVRVTWGFFMLLYLFIAWEIIRWVLGGIVTLFGR